MISGTDGESPTTTDAEKSDLLQAVVEAVGDRAHVVAGVGTFDTVHTVHLAQQAAKAGAHGLLVVTPYYSRPPQAGCSRTSGRSPTPPSCRSLLYDIPHRTGIADRHRDAARARRARPHRRRQGRQGRPGRHLQRDRRDRAGLLRRRRRHDAAAAVGRRGRRRRHLDPLLRPGHEGDDRGVRARRRRRGAARCTASCCRSSPASSARRARSWSRPGCALRGLDVGPVRLPLVDATEHEIEPPARRSCRGRALTRRAPPGQPSSSELALSGEHRNANPPACAHSRPVELPRPQCSRPAPLTIAAPFVALGRRSPPIWRALAAMVGGTARAAGRNAATARDLPPEHRRDGAALGVLAFGADQPGWRSGSTPPARSGGPSTPRAARSSATARCCFRSSCSARARTCCARSPEPESRGRLLVGSLAITVSVLGLFDLWARRARRPRTAASTPAG